MSTHPTMLAPKNGIAKCPTCIIGLDQITDGGLPHAILDKPNRAAVAD